MFGPEATRERRAGATRRQRGLSIVEVMVGLVVSLLVGLAATGSAISFSASQRMGIGAGGGVVNVNTTLAAVKSNIAAGGLGFFGDEAHMCARLNLSVGGAVVRDNAPFVPVSITRGPVDDQVDVFHGSRVEAGANARLRGATDGKSADLDNFLPAQDGDVVLLAPALPNVPGARPCLLRTATVVTPALAPSPQRLTFGDTGLFNSGVFSTPTDYAAEDRVAVLGRLNWSRYRLEGNNLLLERRLENNASVVIARNVMTFRAQYGVSSAALGSTTVENWVDAEGAPWGNLAQADVRRVRALRLGLVVRSPVREKSNEWGDCEATAQVPTLFGREVAVDAAPDWTCYRYSTSIVVVPLRNVVLGARS